MTIANDLAILSALNKRYRGKYCCDHCLYHLGRVTLMGSLGKYFVSRLQPHSMLKLKQFMASTARQHVYMFQNNELTLFDYYKAKHGRDLE